MLSTVSCIRLTNKHKTDTIMLIYVHLLCVFLYCVHLLMLVGFEFTYILPEKEFEIRE